MAEIAAPGITDPGFGWRDSKAFSTRPSGSPQLRLFLDLIFRICQNSFSPQMANGLLPPRSSANLSLPVAPPAPHLEGGGGGNVGTNVFKLGAFCQEALRALRTGFGGIGSRDFGERQERGRSSSSGHTRQTAGGKMGAKAGLVSRRNWILVCSSKLMN